MADLPWRRSSPAAVASATAPGTGGRAPTALLIAGVFLFGANMRPLATSVGPLIHQIDSGLRLSGATSGLLVTIPLLCFGAVAPLAAPLQRRFGIARTAVAILAAVAGGLLLRVTGGVVLLLAGTTLAAAGAACGNVLLPVIVGRSFATRVGSISALYTTALVGTAALAAGTSVPLAHLLGGGWRAGLLVWAAPAVVALIVWLALLRGEPAARASTNEPRARMRDVTRQRVTWQLTVFFAAQSWGFYAILAWLPSIYENHGIGATSAGLLLGLSAIIAVPAALIVPTLAARSRDQATLAVAFTAFTLAGYVGLLLAPAGAPALWAVLIGVGQGACFPLALTMIVLRSGSAALTAPLSTHVQCVGYLLAAAGPLAIGALHDATGSWTISLLALVALLAPQAVAGAGAGRRRTLSGAAAVAGG